MGGVLVVVVISPAGPLEGKLRISNRICIEEVDINSTLLGRHTALPWESERVYLVEHGCLGLSNTQAHIGIMRIMYIMLYYRCTWIDSAWRAAITRYGVSCPVPRSYYIF